MPEENYKLTDEISIENPRAIIKINFREVDGKKRSGISGKLKFYLFCFNWRNQLFYTYNLSIDKKD